MKLYNSLTRKIEEFIPIKTSKVGLYACGPTVYDSLTIGNWRTYILGDTLYRTLKYFGSKVTYVMNITDVGHLTGDNLGDADIGEDRMEKAAKREGKTAWDIAKFYTDDFLEGLKKLNLIKPDILPKATDHIKEQIALIQKIEEAKFTYKTSDGIYFNTKAYEKSGNKYGELSTLDKIKEGARVEKNPEKKDPRDFALWKFSKKGEKRHMEWESPWGTGFPGWHIECSAMSMKYLGEQFDIHVGGEDLRSTHHPNEIAQSEAATGKKPFVKYWVHGRFLLVDGGRMGKSLGNAYTLHDIEKKGFDPLTLRYLYLTGHYRDQLNFTWDSLKSAQIALDKLRSIFADLRAPDESTRTRLSEDKLGKINEFRVRFENALNEDLSVPKALSIAWEVVKSNIPNPDKYDLILSFDEVLGLKLAQVSSIPPEADKQVSSEVQKLIDKRQELRKQKKYEEADKIRKEIEACGYKLEDNKDKVKIKPK